VLCQLEDEGGAPPPSGWLRNLPAINRCFEGKAGVADIIAALGEEREAPGGAPPAIEEALAALARGSPLSQVRCAALGWGGLGWAGLGWAGLGWAGLGWAGLGWAGLVGACGACGCRVLGAAALLRGWLAGAGGRAGQLGRRLITRAAGQQGPHPRLTPTHLAIAPRRSSRSSCCAALHR
jgi:hypothetical protein